jgi:3-hydroxymyristoyl/3-hydroxydecanoyl-(acyl carrier protein) dehydratase
MTAAPALLTEPELLELRRDGDQVTLCLHVQPGLSWFEGHFSEVALLPGVVQTHWAVTFAQQYFAVPLRLVSMSNMKFMRFIFPGARIELHLRYTAAKHEVAFEYREAGAVSASGRMVFADLPT